MSASPPEPVTMSDARLIAYIVVGIFLEGIFLVTFGKEPAIIEVTTPASSSAPVTSVVTTP